MGSARHTVDAGGLGPWLLAVLLLGAGCARTGAMPAGASGPVPAAPGDRTVGSPGSPSEATASPGVAAPAGPAAPEDPSEVMTQAELAAIPDPVPGGEPEPGSPSLRPAPEDAASGDSAGATDDRGGAEPPSAADQSNGGPAGGSSAPSAGFLWRVQIFASSELAQADRVAKGAAQRLGVDYVIHYEGKLYKVRLGSFATEADAQSLRERTVREGFPGAFRVRTSNEGTGGTN